ncbi:MAG: gamma-glutamyltransferase family protein, partial [Planctomycetes bacterium]|nr:gamma-glutamyltransferase family protein [Planctomycetota bacterium]
MLRYGGNAVDAAVATAITLAVVAPCSNGIGSDAFAIVWDGRKLHGLNASGRSPAGWTVERFAQYDKMPLHGWDAVTVPGAVSAWTALSKRFGKLPFGDLFAPAIRYARDGFLVSPKVAWKGDPDKYAGFDEFIAGFLPKGRAPRAGELFRYPDQARTLERIAETDGAAFYRGDLAEKIAAHSAECGGAMTADDLAEHTADWVEPIRQDYRGWTLHEIPPNGQGLAALIMLGILEHFPMSDFPVDSADSLHVQIEAMKLAFADAYRYIADPAAMELAPADLLDADYLASRAALIDMARASRPKSGRPKQGGTVYLTAADASGMMVSMIQSNFHGFGSRVVVPGTGISLQNRGSGFTLEAGHPNRVGPRKRPFQTIIPGFLTRGGRPMMSFGVMGGHVQPQGHAQMVVRLVDYGQNPQAAADAPRWVVKDEQTTFLEAGTKPEVVEELIRRGHPIQVKPSGGGFGGAQLIYRLDDGYVGASEPRLDGQAVGF